jgi:pyruvate dehydrogenase phosphatase
VYPTGRRGIPRNYFTPPYVTALPEVMHYERDTSDMFLILACDGLWDDLSSEKSVEIVSQLIQGKYQGNYATALIKAALSDYEHVGVFENWDRIQHHYSIPPPKSRRYRDDMTINVVFFDGVERKGNEIPTIPNYQPPQPPQLDIWVNQIKSRFLSKL